MSDMRDQQNIEHALRKRRGLTPIKSEALSSVFETSSDLHWTCPLCKTRYTGTKEDLMGGCYCG